MVDREAQKDQIQQATDIVDLVGEHVALRPKGREFVGLCPFHEDKNPSMSVSPTKQIFKCFSCGAGGDVFSFVSNYHKMSFPEAMRYLADRAGIKLEPAQGEADQAMGDRQQIAQANDQALNFYREMLTQAAEGEAAREYVRQRGISAEMVEAFQLGYAADRWDALAQTAQRRNWARRGLELGGLIGPRKSGNGYYDRLRHRLIFPIFDAIGRPIAFGGRKLREEDEPKYLNSPETILFNKSATLYGIHLAKKPIIDSKTAVIVEGYTDVIACHQAGARNVVATLGTALTEQHVKDLRRYAEKVVLVFDPDAAGQKAADRAVELFLGGEVDVAIAVLPEGQDPADLLAEAGGLERWREITDQAEDALRYQFGRVEQELKAATTVTGRQHITEQYVNRLVQLGLGRSGPIRRTLMVQQLAALLGTREAVIDDILQRSQARSRGPGGAGTEVSGGNSPGDNVQPDVALGESCHKLKAIQLAERQLIGCLIRQNELFHHPLTDGRTLDEAISPAEMVSSAGQALYERVYQRLCDGQEVALARLLSDLAAEEQQELVRWSTEADAEVDRACGGQEDYIVEVLSAAADAIMNHHREKSYREVKHRLNAGGVDENQLLRQLMEHRRANPSPTRIARLKE